MSLKTKSFSNIFLKLGDFLTGKNIYNRLRFLERSQYWTREQIDAYQNEKLRSLILHAYQNVPFYTELFNRNQLKPDDIQTKDDLYKLPIITKKDLKLNKSKWKAVNLRDRSLIYSSSSGSTGEPFQFYTTRNSDSFHLACAIRAWYWNGYKLGDKYVKISMNPRTSKLKKIQDLLNNSLYLSSTSLTPEVFMGIANSILSFDPKIIRCYPVPLSMLAEIIKESKGCYNGKSLVAINTTGSTLSQSTRDLIENIFKVKIFDSYSCEGGADFTQCPESGFYHPSEEYCISEYMEDDFTKSHPDRPMRHITTDLHNYASPFIRYDSQDYVVLGPDEICKCGKSFRNIRKILGRDSDILKTPSGKYLIVENFVAYFEWRSEVEQIQIVQKRINEIYINLVVNEKFTGEVQKDIYNYWKEYIGEDVNIILNTVTDIKLTPSGKRRTVIRDSEISLFDER